MASSLSTVCGLLVVVALSLNTVSSQSCNVDDQGQQKTFEDGKEFQLDMSGKCITFKCEKGGYQPITIQCLNVDDQQCYDLGKELSEGCVKRVCGQNDGKIGFQLTNIQCTDSQGGCHDHGETFTKQHEGSDISCTCNIDGNHIGYTCP